jgi:ubiquinone/menaquinone biosynthesis C-methylase UbiE
MSNLSYLEYYSENDLGSHPLFPGGFINYGYWKSHKSGHINLGDRISSQIDLYNEVLSGLDIEKSPRPHLLEVGCGKGNGAMLAVYDHSVAHVTGIDSSQQQVDRAKGLLKGNLKDKLTFIKAEAEHLPFKDGTFDGVYSVEAIQHFQSPNFF